MPDPGQDFFFFFFPVKCVRQHSSGNIDGILVSRSRFTAVLGSPAVCSLHSPAGAGLTAGQASPGPGRKGVGESSGTSGPLARQEMAVI